MSKPITFAGIAKGISNFLHLANQNASSISLNNSAANSAEQLHLLQPTAKLPQTSHSSEILAMLKGNNTPEPNHSQAFDISKNFQKTNEKNFEEWISKSAEDKEKSQEQFGLAGLLDILRMDDQDVTTLALGTDLTSLGLDLNSSSNLFSTFFSPWNDSRNALDYLLPSCYNAQQPSSYSSKITHFSDETLFYIFYSMPKDKMQDLAAQELYNRNWKFHKELKIWLTRDLSVELISSSNQFEKGMFVFFDVLGWEKVKKEFLLVYEQIEERPVINKTS